MNELAFFETDDGSIEVRVEQETVWLSQDQMARIFERERSVITKHLRNVFRDGELAEESVCANFAHTAVDGKTYQTKFFNLDAILSVGYRVNSKRGIHFRQWATRVLKEHLTRGYTLDRQRLEHNARELEAALLLVRRTLSNAELAHDAGSGLAEIVVRYTQTFLWLQRYDEGLLTDPRGHPGGALP
ncbi:virulence RhuM family protein, partial [Thauera aminoaromatica]|uniref:virulence RhuM family protein n=1 Tax=Thauera aminoaromatica TaxID=164330 RepID=UPI0035ADD94F